MIGHIVDRFFNWMEFEPAIGIMMVLAAIVLFVKAYNKNGAFQPASLWEWIRRLIEAASVAVLFLGLLWAFRVILNDNYIDFQKTHGRISEANYESVKRIWGAPHVQRELHIVHYMEKTVKEEIPREDPGEPPLYRMRTETVEVEQNSILGLQGEIELTPNRRKKGSAYYNGFEIKVYLAYEVINSSSETTEAHFNFPVYSEQMSFENFLILENGQDISIDLRFSPNQISWKRTMPPGERYQIEVSYNSRGLDYFYYRIPYPREIRDFSLKITVHNLPLSEVNYPEGCITPTRLSEAENGEGVLLEWVLDKAVTTAGMGIALPKPEQPGAKVSLVLRNSPYAFTMLLVAVCLTMLIQKEEVSFIELALLSAVYCLLFFVMSSLSDLVGFWGSLVLGNCFTLGLAFLLYRKHPVTLSKWLLLSLIGFFTVIYPLSGLFPRYQKSFSGIVLVGLIVYLFSIAFYSRIQHNVKRENSR